MTPLSPAVAARNPSPSVTSSVAFKLSVPCTSRALLLDKPFDAHRSPGVFTRPARGQDRNASAVKKDSSSSTATLRAIIICVPRAGQAQKCKRAGMCGARQTSALVRRTTTLVFASHPKTLTQSQARNQHHHTQPNPTRTP